MLPPCHPQVDYQTITNTSEYMYDLVPLAINFGAMTAYSVRGGDGAGIGGAYLVVQRPGYGKRIPYM